MRKSFFYQTIWIQIILFVLISCDNENINSIVLETNEVTVWIEQATTVKILSNSQNLSVTSNDNKIVTATIEGDEIILKSNKIEGNTTILVTDKITKDTKKVTVYVKSLGGAWRISESNDFKTTLEIEVDDEIKNDIEQELILRASFRIDNIYGFSSNSNQVEIITPNNNKVYGTYSFNYPKLTITNQGEIVEYSMEYLGLTFIKITEDLSSHYKSKYSDMKIDNVKIIQYLRYISY